MIIITKYDFFCYFVYSIILVGWDIRDYMLYLSRKVGESVIIDGKIEIIVTVINNKQVKLGIEAPRNSAVYRKELLEKIKKENNDAIATVNELICDVENVPEDFLKETKDINNEISDALEKLSDSYIPNILNITSKTGELLKKYSDIEMLKNSDIQQLLKAVCNNYKRLLVELTKKYKVINNEINIITEYLDKLSEAA